MIDAETRRAILAYAEEHGDAAAAGTFEVSPSTIRRWRDPRAAEASRHASREAKKRRRGSCATCGEPTSIRSDNTPARYCYVHSPVHVTWWTRERCLRSLHRLAAQLARTPSARDLLDVALLNTLDGRSEYPTPSTLIRRFGTYRSAILAAGLAPNRPGQGRRARIFPPVASGDAPDRPGHPRAARSQEKPAQAAHRGREA